MRDCVLLLGVLTLSQALPLHPRQESPPPLPLALHQPQLSRLCHPRVHLDSNAPLVPTAQQALRDPSLGALLHLAAEPSWQLKGATRPGSLAVLVVDVEVGGGEELELGTVAVAAAGGEWQRGAAMWQQPG